MYFILVLLSINSDSDPEAIVYYDSDTEVTAAVIVIIVIAGTDVVYDTVAVIAATNIDDVSSSDFSFYEAYLLLYMQPMS
jgi:hypothetical protein